MDKNYINPNQQAAMQRLLISRSQNPVTVEVPEPEVKRPSPQVPQAPQARQVPTLSPRSVCQNNTEYLNLMRPEIRLIGFIGIVHNLSMIFFLLAWFPPLIYILDLTSGAFGRVFELKMNGYWVTKTNVECTIVAMVVAILMLIGSIFTDILLRCSTNPYKNRAEAKKRAQPLLLAYGTGCNFAIFFYLPNPEHSVGMYLIFSNCLRVVCICVVNNYIHQLHVGIGMYANNGMTGSASSYETRPQQSQANISRAPTTY